MMRAKLGFRRRTVARLAIGGVGGAAVLASLALGVAATPAFATKRLAKTRKLTTLNLAFSPQFQNMPVALGQKIGIFAHYGVYVNLEVATNVTTILADLQSGQAQLGFVSDAFLLKSNQAGQYVKCVAPMGLANIAVKSFPTNAIMVAANSPITNVKQLNGQTFALNQIGGSESLYTEAAVDAGGGNFSSIKFVSIPFADMAAALKAGTVTAAFGAAPYIEAGEKAGEIKVLEDLDSQTVPWTTQCYGADASYLAGHKTLLDRFAEGMDQSILYAHAHPKQAAAELSFVSGLPTSQAKLSVPPEIDYEDNLAPRTLLNFQAFEQKYGFFHGSPLPLSELAWVAPGTPMKKLLFNDRRQYVGPPHKG
ncbi:MAG: ABC transporter substrate-binding protein [Terriglobales bacterium]